jgi:hypothetical protein
VIREKALGPDHPEVATSLNSLALLYLRHQGRYADALPVVRRTISNKTAAAWAALPVLYGAQSAKFISGEDALEDSLNVAQVALRTAIAETLNKLGVRFSAGTDRLAQLVRTDQDLTAEAGRLDKQILEAVSREPSKRDAAMEQKTRDRVFCQPSILSALLALHRPGSIATSPWNMSTGAVRAAKLQRSRPVSIVCALPSVTCALALTSHGCCRSPNAWPPKRRPNRQGFIW